MEYTTITIKRITDISSPLVDELTTIEADAFDDGALNRWSFPVIIRHGAVYVLECDGQTCGVADIIKDWLNPRLAFIYNFVIRKEDRRKGLGYKFLSILVEKLRESGIKQVQLTVAPDNRCAIGLYEKAGFRKIAELPDEYGPSIDRLLYELELEG